MALRLEWTGRGEVDRIAEIRWRSFGSRPDERPHFLKKAGYGRWQDGDVCIAADGASGKSVDVGTATALSMHMHLRGQRLACQGVAYVGTSKSHRRRTSGEKGVASQVMNAIVDKARERGEVVSALMPFRVSFYEHFGFGIVERQNVWTFPLASCPPEPGGSFRFGTPDDKPAMIACRLRQSKQGHCDVETSERALNEWFEANADDAQLFVNEIDGQIRSYAWIHSRHESDQWTAVVTRPAWDSPEAFRMLLSLLGSFKDQYPAGRWVLPRDVPLNLLLKEHHVPGGDKHPRAATCRQQSRMQVRVLNHAKFLDGQKLADSAAHVRGSAVLAVEESEGGRSVFKVDIEGGRISAAASTASPDVVLKDFTWAPIACGDLRASTAASLGLVDVTNNAALATLDALSVGPAPYCYEYF